MEYRQFGLTQREVSIVGQGTWNLEVGDRAQAISALQTGLDLGMNHIDTAEMYGSGRVEELVAEAISGRRNEVFLVSKVLPENASRRKTVTACERSLARLRTDRLDCYLLHWRGSYALEDTFSAFDQLFREGKVLSWGVSNFEEADLEEALEIIGNVGEHQLVCNQVLYHLQERAIEHAVIPWCEDHKVAVTAYSPFGSGNFPDPSTREGRVLQEIAAAHEATPRQVALSFLLRWPSTFAIPKASKPKHVKDNADTANLRLSKEELSRIDEAFPRGPKPKELPMI
jgi:diketogulonate reductase-like aldo/keto reductase